MIVQEYQGKTGYQEMQGQKDNTGIPWQYRNTRVKQGYQGNTGISWQYRNTRVKQGYQGKTEIPGNIAVALKRNCEILT